MRKICSALVALMTVCAVLACSAALFLLRISPVFARGEGYELYLGDSSSPILRTDSPLLEKIACGPVSGESARYSGDVHEALAEKYFARLLFTERAGDVCNYYFYSPVLGGGVVLNGEKVNLHIAVRGETTVAGTPLIYGSM